jgi:HAMP domain-containing protein
MSIAGLLSLLFALIAILLLVLYALQRRDLRKLAELSQQLQRIVIGGRLPGRVDLTSDKPEVAALITAVNHLLTRTTSGNESDAAYAPKLFTALGDRIHEAVLVHGDVILYCNQLRRNRPCRVDRATARRPCAAGVRGARQREYPPPPRRREYRGAL